MATKPAPHPVLGCLMTDPERLCKISGAEVVDTVCNIQGYKMEG